MNENESPTSVDDLANRYFQIKEQRSQLKAQYDDQDASLKEQMAEIEKQMLTTLNDLGVNSLNGDGFTTYRQEQQNYSIADEGQFYPWAQENDALDMFQKRLASGKLKAYVEQFGELPPGVTVFRQYVCRINRK